MEKHDSLETPEFAPGPEISDPAAALKWLNHRANPQGQERRLVRLPVLVQWVSPFRLEIESVRLGTPDQADDSDSAAIHLFVDDGIMGVSFPTWANSFCPDRNAPCCLWLEGHWGPLYLEEAAGEPGKIVPNSLGEWPFTVLRCDPFLAGDAPNIFIEKTD